MKKFLLFALAVSALAISCNKVDTSVNQLDENTVEFRATIVENVDTKSNYDLAGSTGTFYWTGTEKIGWMKWVGYFQQTVLTSKTSADSKENTLVFTGTPSGDEVEYAFYPVWDGVAYSGIGWSSSPFKLLIPESTSYNPSAPLKDIVPMIAKLDGDNFEFSPVTALIGVHVQNLPADARIITLSSSGVALSGEYYLTDSPTTKYASNLDYVRTNGLTTTMAANASNTSGVKTITFSSGLGKGEYAFYFPVSVGTLPNLTISIKDSGESVLQTVSYDKSITTSRGVISDLPLMDLAKATSFEITGTADAPYAYVGKFGPDATSARYAIATTEDAAKTAAASGTLFGGVGVENKVSLAQATSGQYYVAYQVLNSSSEVLYTGSEVYYYLAPTDITAYTGQYSVGYTSSTIAFPDAAKTLTLATSNNLAKGNIMLTEFMGIHSDVSANDPAVLTYLIDGDNPASTTITTSVGPVYGNLSGSKITFIDVLNQPMTKDKYGDYNFLHNYYANQANLAFSLGVGGHTISCDAGYIIFAYGSSYTEGANTYFRIQGLYADLP